MERYHMFKLGLAILFYAAYCIRPMLGLKSSHLVTNQTFRPEDINVFYQGVDGTPGVDFPVLSFIPKTTFSCDGIESGYYADLDTDCQVFHICEEGKKISFLCPNGTIFEQADLICEWWYKVNCTNAPNLYQESAEHLRADIARRKSFRKISVDSRERNHGAVMRIEESASITAQQNGKTYPVSSGGDSRLRGQPSGVDFRRPSKSNLVQSAIDKDQQNAPRKRYNDGDTGNYINNEYDGQISYSRSTGDELLYTRLTTPSSLSSFSSSHLDEGSSRKPFTSNRGSVKFGSKIIDSSSSPLKSRTDEYDLDIPQHKSVGTQQNIGPKFTQGKTDLSKVVSGQPKQESTAPFTKNDIQIRRLESSDSEELQIPQETAAFSPNSYNSLQSNSRKFPTTTHPNHRPTYSDLKRPDFSNTKTVNLINSVTPQYITTQSINSGKPFIGSTVGANLFRKTEKKQQKENTVLVTKTLPSTVQPFISTTYESFDLNPPVSSTHYSFVEDLTSTVQPEYTTTVSPSEIKTTRTVDYATVYGSFSRGSTTAAPQNGVKVKLGKHANKVSIQLSKSLGGETSKYGSSTSKPLASDGFVRISGGLAKSVTGTNSQGPSSGRIVASKTENEIVTVSPSNEKGTFTLAGSTAVPNILMIPKGAGETLSGQDEIQKTKEIRVNSAQSTTGRPDLHANTNRPALDFENQNNLGTIYSTTVRSNVNTGSNSIHSSRDGKTISASVFSGIGSTVNSVSVGLNSHGVDATYRPALETTGGTVVSNVQGSTGFLNSPVTAESIRSSPKGSVAGTKLAGSTLSTIVGGNSILAGGTGFTVVPNVLLASSAIVPSTSVIPDISISENNQNTVSPSTTDGFAHTTVRSVVSGSVSQATDSIFAPESGDTIRKNNGTDSASNSYRPNFYPTKVKSVNIGNTAKPSQEFGLKDNKFYQSTPASVSDTTVAPSPSPHTYLPLNSSSVEINLSQNDIGSTLSPVSSPTTISTGFKSSTTSPLGGKEIATTSGFYVTRNSNFKSTPPPFGFSTATVSSNYVEPTPIVNISPNSGEEHALHVTLLPPNPDNTVPGDLLSKSETRFPRPFQKTINSIDGGSSTKTHTSTSDQFTYQISSARPFELPKDRATPAPTIPTPFTTARSVQTNVDNMINALQEMMDTQDYSSETPRPGLIVPPSAGPQTLHTLAQYFANALDGIVAEREKETGEALDEESKEKLTSLLTQMTMYRYKELFKGTELSDEESVETTTHSADEELHGDDSHHLVETPELRQLARNFSLALSSYLNDPNAFRKELETFRPTEPSVAGDETGVGDEELLNFSDSDSKSSLPPLFPTPQSPSSTWGYIIAPKASHDLDVKNSLNPDLHTADSQSFVPAFNNLAANNVNKVEATTKSGLPEDHWTTSSGVTKLWQSALSINPSVLNENLDGSHSTEPYAAGSTPSPSVVRHNEIQYDLRTLPKLKLNSTQLHGILIDFVNTTKPDDTNRLHRLLRKLNTTEDEFIHRMKEIESNPLTKRLILLLISECGANVTKNLETDPIQNVSELLGSSSAHSAVANLEEGRVSNSDIPELVDPSLHEDNQDARALQLLNSLYAIASKFGK